MPSYDLLINGLKVNAFYSDSSINDIFLPLLRRLTRLQKEAQRRIAVFLAAPPGAGKSTLVAFLEQLSKEREDLVPIQTLGMDGFHHYQDFLLSHYAERDGVSIPMVKIKGSPITFDLEALEKRIKDVAEGKRCGWPIYDRTIHNPIDNAITVDAGIVLIEGNYLLLDEPGWRDLSKYAEYTIFVTADETMLRTRLIQRRVQTGVDLEEATRFVDRSDMNNLRLVLNHSLAADLSLELDETNEYRLKSPK